MSNHHPGNSWYRRLIHSNRPLYRACPKHTKLLVSKAIVQAVEQQGGRFLERNKKTGIWTTVSYKRAVDKTSQGLRERDREEEHRGGPEEIMSADALPASFSGRMANPNLTDLANVAIAHATRTTGLPPPAAKPPASRCRAGAVRTLPTAAGRPTATAGNGAAQRTVSNDSNNSVRCGPPDGGARRDENLSPLPPSLQVRQSSMYRLLGKSNLLPSEQLSPPGASVPSTYPTKLNNLNGSPKIGGQRSKGSLIDDDDDEDNKNGADRQRKQQQPSLPMQHPPHYPPGLNPATSAGLFPPFAGPPSGVYGAPPPFMTAASSLGYGLGPVTAYGPGVSGFVAAPFPTPGEAPPPLSRLTTQVSDWLKGSFWPVPVAVGAPPPGVVAPAPPYPRPVEPTAAASDPTRPPDFAATTSDVLDPNRDNRKMSRHLAVSTATAITKMIPPPPPGTMQERRMAAAAAAEMEAKLKRKPEKSVYEMLQEIKRQKTGELPEITTVPPPKPAQPVQIRTIPPLHSPTTTQQQQQPVAPAAVSTDENNIKTEEEAEVTSDEAKRTELEQSVSASLLALASAPSRLIQGFTSFFHGGQEGGGVRTLGMDHRQTTTVPPPAPVPFKKSTRSLLDDEEETEGEARLRTVPTANGGVMG